MNVLSLDLATTSGWAAGRIGEQPTWGSHDFSDKGGNGAVLGKYRHWINQRCYDLAPKLIVYETPYVPHPGQKTPINMATLFRLIGLMGFTEATAYELQIECRQATASEIAKAFTGQGSWEGGRVEKKAQTIAMCRRFGWEVEDDDDAADALALWSYAEKVIDPAAAARRRANAGLELPLDHAAKPRMRSAAGGPSPAALKTQPDERKSSNGPRQSQFTNF